MISPDGGVRVLISAHLEVPGARLRYEVSGAGPVLLLIPGAAADAAAFAGIAPRLRNRFTVVAYDPQGTCRSPQLGPPSDITVQMQADDAHRLLTEVGLGPATVFGSSAGAVTGLELVARHPEQVRCLVAHEPPVTQLLPDAAQHQAGAAELHVLHRDKGVGAALARFLADNGLGAGANSGPTWQPAASDPEEEATNARFLNNLDMFFAHVIEPLNRYRPDISALRHASTRLVVAAGTESAGQLPYRAAIALADALMVPVTELPGDHRGSQPNPNRSCAPSTDSYDRLRGRCPSCYFTRSSTSTRKPLRQPLPPSAGGIYLLRPQRSTPGGRCTTRGTRVAVERGEHPRLGAR
jgi:pimeloyl-ACP methyl ester carboxylesterase